MAFDRAFDRARDLLTDDGPHRSADEVVFHGGEDNRQAVHLALDTDHGFKDANFFGQGLQTVLVWLAGFEFQRISGIQR